MRSCPHGSDSIWSAALASLLLGSMVSCTQANPGFGQEAAKTELGGETDEASTSSSSADTHPADDGSASRSTTGDADGGHGTSSGVATEGGEDTTETEHAAKLVFVTSEHYRGAEIGGLAGADAKCGRLAQAAGLPGVYRAWLSDSTGEPAQRMNPSGPYELVDGTQVAKDWDSLVSGVLENPIELTELGDSHRGILVCVGGEVWTNTKIDGTRRDDRHCDDWSSSDGVSFTGYTSHADAFWTEGNCLNVGCSTLLPLYCVQQ